jgi:DMSO/TMAO reductase YedYZ molybdopterin-dependent catalytic subunit
MIATYNAQRFGFAAGVGAAGAMLVAIVVLRALSAVISLPEIVAEGLLVVMPGALFSSILDSLQHAAKPLFYLAVAIGILVVGGLLGRWYARAPGWRQALKIVLAMWAGFGLLGYPLLHAGFMGQYLQAGPIWHGFSLLLVFGVYGVALSELYRALAGRSAAAEAGIDPTRRTLLRNAVIVLVATLGTGAAYRLLTGGVGGVPAVASAGPTAAGQPAAAPYDLPGLVPEVSATESFYTVSKNFLDPTVAVGGWKLKVDGLVDTPLELDYAALTALPSSGGYYTLMCISNEVGGELWNNAYWRGVRLRDLLAQAGARTDAVKAIFSAADDYKDSVAMAAALQPDTLLAWEMNGEPLRNEHGFPARLLIPGIYGMKNVKWLTGITVSGTDFRGFWQSQGWDDAAAYQTASRIDVPRGRETVSPGTLAVGGVAFAGSRGITAVEVSTDQGQTWQPAQLKPALSPNAWQLWRADVPVSRDVKSLRVRATDGLGHVQPRELNPPFPAGSTGYHNVTIAVS